MRARAVRFAGFFGLWLVLSDAAVAGLPFGLLAAGLACWASLRLSPGAVRLDASRLLARVTRQVMLGGVDIAVRAFNPRLPLRPGLLAYASAHGAGPARDVLAAVASLSPGALPAGLDAAGHMVVHTLDTAQDTAADLAATEALIHG